MNFSAIIPTRSQCFKPGFHMIATIAEKKLSDRSDHMETTLHSYPSYSKSTKMHCVRSRFSRWLPTSLRKHPFLLATSPLGTFRAEERLRQKFHTDDANQCLHNKSGSHGVPNIICPILRVFWSILVNCVYLPTSSSETQNIDCFVRDSSRLHLTFVAFCLLSVIRKQ